MPTERWRAAGGPQRLKARRQVPLPLMKAQVARRVRTADLNGAWNGYPPAGQGSIKPLDLAQAKKLEEERPEDQTSAPGQVPRQAPPADRTC